MDSTIKSLANFCSGLQMDIDRINRISEMTDGELLQIAKEEKIGTTDPDKIRVFLYEKTKE